MGILTILGALAGGVIVHLVACELYEKLPSIAEWLVKRAVRRLPDHARERYEEEWLAHLYEAEGGLSKMAHALQCLVAVPALAKVLLTNAAVGFRRNMETGEWTVSGLGRSITIGDITAANFLAFMFEHTRHHAETQDLADQAAEAFHRMPELARFLEQEPKPEEKEALAKFLLGFFREAGEGSGSH